MTETSRGDGGFSRPAKNTRIYRSVQKYPKTFSRERGAVHDLGRIDLHGLLHGSVRRKPLGDRPRFAGRGWCQGERALRRKREPIRPMREGGRRRRPAPGIEPGEGQPAAQPVRGGARARPHRSGPRRRAHTRIPSGTGEGAHIHSRRSGEGSTASPGRGKRRTRGPGWASRTLRPPGRGGGRTRTVPFVGAEAQPGRLVRREVIGGDGGGCWPYPARGGRRGRYT